MKNQRDEAQNNAQGCHFAPEFFSLQLPTPLSCLSDSSSWLPLLQIGTGHQLDILANVLARNFSQLNAPVWYIAAQV